MELTVFAKSRTTKEGKPFQTYFSKLTKKDGTEITTELKFREECGAPKQFPCNIIVDKKDANLVEKPITYEKDGEEKDAIQRRMWIANWTEGAEYVDHSLDDFE
jgi:hypothetical protein